MHGQAVRYLAVRELRKQELIDQSGLQIGVKQPAVGADWIDSQSKVTENILSDQLRN